MENILTIIQDDVGGRGIRALLDPPRDRKALHEAAEAVLSLPPHSHVAIITGFPCVQGANPPTETDGICGTFALAHTLYSRQCNVHILTDEINAGVFTACITRWTELTNQTINLHAFPPNVDLHDNAQLNALLPTIACWIAIERPGAATDGHYYTMRARDISASAARLDRCFAYAHQNNVPTIAIGDGGNELGLGSVRELTKVHIPNGQTIAAAMHCRHLVLASISDWGGYAVCAAVAWLDPSVSVVQPNIVAQLAATMVAAGARDGILGISDTFVDGWPLVVSLNRLYLLQHLRVPRFHRLVGPLGAFEWPRLGFHTSPGQDVAIPYAVYSKEGDNLDLSTSYAAIELDNVSGFARPTSQVQVILLHASQLENSGAVDQVASWQGREGKNIRLGVVDASLSLLKSIEERGIHVSVHKLHFTTDCLGELVPYCQKKSISIWIDLGPTATTGPGLVYSTTFATWLLEQTWVDSVIVSDKIQLDQLAQAIHSKVLV
ncbi:hypothetical protein LEN26_012442 [Aphanomyces euteiches]|nr:hypothetical protein LEN26_012442 [Aphanomyces euteiches]KAH9127654.1 hypothetical protein AeMF1_002074 [Aphanomyces euteiches]KAH9194859.1 hypothetical protein AeNC1_003162 [Aphanomyces euteiches]